MIYYSDNYFPDLAEGLIQGCAKHFNESIKLTREDFEVPKRTKFLIEKIETQ